MDGLPGTGERLGHYRIGAKLGAGGMGEVYRARDERLHRDVAIKVLPITDFDDAAARSRLVREARAAAALNHPYICTVYEVGETDGQTYIAMELIDGATLSARLTEGPLPVDQIIRYGAQLSEALGHAHDRGVLHRDLKCANVIVTPAGRVKILDFGLAKKLSAPELTTQLEGTAMGAGTVAGTLPYMPPEQLRGQAALPASDVWPLGVMLYEMATGARPFQGHTGFEVSAAILNQRPAPMPASVPAALQAIIGRCLEKEPSQRYRSGSEVHAALEMLQTSGNVAAPISDTRLAVPATAPAPLVLPDWITRRRAIWLGIVAVIIAAGVTGWEIWGPNGSRSGPLRSFAVLPFVNVKADAAVEHLCEGIADGLIRQIAAFPAMRVTNIQRALDFKGSSGRPVDAFDAGRELTVDNVLSGTLVRENGHLLVTVELVDVAGRKKIWDHQYDRNVGDVLDVQDEIVNAIMQEGLRLQLSTAEKKRIVHHPTTDPEAYDLYLQARIAQRQGNEQGYGQARELLEKAIVRDRNFALAYASISGIYAMMVTDGLVRPNDAWPEVSRYLGEAQAIDASLGESFAFAHAKAFLYDWDWAGTERARRALMQTISTSLDPVDLRSVAVERWAMGAPGEALQLVRRTRQLDPLNPEITTLEADYLVQNGELDAATKMYLQAIDMDAASSYPYFGLAEALYRLGRFNEAISRRKEAHAIAGDDRVADAFAAEEGKGDEGYQRADRVWVLQQLTDLKERAKTKYASPFDFARAYAQLGDKEQAFKYMAEAFNDRSPGLVFLNVDRAWDKVRSDPRFLDAVRRVRLPERQK